ncbi:MAG: DVU0298 family protein [Desulfomonilaceae bacterium]
MSEAAMRSRKKDILGLLQSKAFEQNLSLIVDMPGRQVINALFPLLCHSDSLIKWRAVRAMGAVLARLAQVDAEGARIVMRRLMWSLNDESGGIGWGAPEVMGEAMAQSPALAKEYASMLGSYADETGNFLEHEPLQRGLLWAWARLSETRPEALRGWEQHLPKYLQSEDPSVKGHAAIAMGNLGLANVKAALEALLADETEFETFESDKIVRLKVKDAAERAIYKLANAG